MIQRVSEVIGNLMNHLDRVFGMGLNLGRDSVQGIEEKMRVKSVVKPLQLKERGFLHRFLGDGFLPCKIPFRIDAEIADSPCTVDDPDNFQAK